MKKISVRILVMLLTIIIATTAIIGISVNLKIKNTLESQTVERLNVLTDGLVQRVGLIQEHVQETIGVINELPQVKVSVSQSGTSETVAQQRQIVNDLLKEFQKGIEGTVEVLFISDLDGNVIMDSLDGSYFGISVLDRSYFASASSGIPAWSEVIFSKGTGNRISVYATPLTDSAGRIQGILASAIKWEVITKSLDAVDVGEGGYAYMIDKTGLVLHHPDREKILVENLGDSDSETLNTQVEEMLSGKEGFGYYTYENIEKINVFRPLGDWFLSITVPTDVVFKPVREMTTYILSVSMIAILLTALISLLISRSISVPIEKMKRAMADASMGRLDNEVIVRQKDEIGQLGTSLNSLLSSLRVKRDQVNAIACGDLEVEVIPSSKEDGLGEALVALKDTMSSIKNDIKEIIIATEQGELKTRLKSESYQGSWKETMVGINTVLETYNRPIQLTKDYLNRISLGDIPAKIDEAFFGDFEEIKSSINGLIIAISSLVGDTKKFIDAAIEGNLDYRAQTDGFNGDYKEIVDGMNAIMDAVVGPIAEAATVLDALSRGDLSARVMGDYNGDHANIKDALNHTMISLEAYIAELASVLESVKNKDLKAKIRGDFQGDFVTIKRSTNMITAALSEFIQEIDVAASQVRIGASAVAQASESLAQGATEQASSVSQISESMREITSQTNLNVLQAKEVAKETLMISTHASEGNESMKELLKAMSDIDEASNRISGIIKVIDEIAFQTNILALNAAVEAARAGEHGKGFAVVAEEVRNLASRSAGAAKDTTALIDQTGKVVAKGMSIASGTAKQLLEIVQQIKSASEKVDQIAKASEEQSIAISEINVGVDQVERVTHMNSSSSEESAATSEEMSSQADVLKDMVEQFEVSRGSISLYDDESAM
ncbi:MULTISPECIES: methyl-accepting chemotaxis protein [unclassified Fusibacter]|uniref:methyl-accepting chemotaxis protein n=1 Tax=unclassified Fusibacter TaxID=2624464 RepID=UPI001013698B|nr:MULTISPECIES: methyl-accepting chemotaxis protein [unclassified Fusibacter]MCK8059625.1 methyl-accepting chemotaxis protein [Fusibacter sp. A2]NPE21426.1 HAMP domain-containing protein [Fusibacter sp. A1]RXV61838.1 methyl-accepting chemotaxis protein [Fusibacter sp. A1]